jgi:SagB-type dehydrogenase family enzyme
MPPAEPGVLRRYHERTKHSPASVRASRHWLDWSIKPLPFKVYVDLEAIEPPPDIGRLCRLSNGVLRWRDLPGRDRYGFRGAPATGALYHVELYLATAGRDDLPAGLYHYGAHDHALRRLRDGDVRGALVDATAHPAVGSAPLVFVLTSTFWRNAWKYQARAYRHAFWDSGAVLANLLALLAADATPAPVLMGFADDAVDWLLGADGVREASLVVVPVGEGAAQPPSLVGLDPLDLATVPLSTTEVRYQELEEAHRASVFDVEDVAAWRSRAGPDAREVPPSITQGAVEQVIERRRSTRRFRPGPIGRSDLDAILAAGTAPIPGDGFVPSPVAPFLLVNAVDGLEAGAYIADGLDLRPIRLGDHRRLAGALALGQDLAADAAVNIYFLADLADVLARLGERGYRVAQVAGGIHGARVELAATALGLGATGLTFFDGEVTRVFEPASQGREVMYLVAVGQRR